MKLFSYLKKFRILSACLPLLILVFSGCENKKNTISAEQCLNGIKMELRGGTGSGILPQEYNLHFSKPACLYSLDECRRNWVMVLAEIQLLFELLTPTYMIDPINLVEPDKYRRDQYPSPTDVYSIVSAILDDVEKTIREIEEDSKPLMNADCMLDLDGFNASIQILFNTKWGARWTETEATLINVASNVILSVFDLVLSHQLELDLNVFLGGFNGQFPEFDLSRDPVGSLRSLGVILYTTPRLLEWNLKPENAARFAKVAPRFAEIIGQLENLVSAVIASDSISNPDNTNNIIRYKDMNQNKAIDGGDVFSIGCTDNLKNNAPCFKDYTVPAGVKSDAVLKILALLHKAQKSLEDASNGLSGTSEIQLSELNAVLSALGEPGTEFLPNAMKIDLSKLFVNPKPLRRYFPVWYQIDSDTQPDPKKGKWEFLIEGEVAAQAPKPPTIYAFIGDAPHFPTQPVMFDYDGKAQPDRSGIMEPTLYPSTATGPWIPADGIWPGMDPSIDGDMSDLTKFENNYIYAVFQDWSFNGALSMDKDALPPPYGNSTPAPNFHPPDNFEANLVVQWLTRHFNRRLKATSNFGLKAP